MRIGAHLRRTGPDAASAIEIALAIGADAVQLFLSSPRVWAGPHIVSERAAAFRSLWDGSGLDPLIAHAPYLVNIASPSVEFLERSRKLIGQTLSACEAWGVKMLVVHSGSGGSDEPGDALARAAKTLRSACREAGSTRIVVELMAGTSGAVASTIAEASRLFDTADTAGLGLCLDTCHLFASGYPIDSGAGVAAVFDELRRHELLEDLVLIHANDSKFGPGERRDRHENIGDGHIGLTGFRALLARPELAGLTAVLETPGDDHRKAADIALLRRLAPPPPGRLGGERPSGLI